MIKTLCQYRSIVLRKIFEHPGHTSGPNRLKTNFLHFSRDGIIRLLRILFESHVVNLSNQMVNMFEQVGPSKAHLLSKIWYQISLI